MSNFQQHLYVQANSRFNLQVCVSSSSCVAHQYFPLHLLCVCHLFTSESLYCNSFLFSPVFFFIHVKIFLIIYLALVSSFQQQSVCFSCQRSYCVFCAFAYFRQQLPIYAFSYCFVSTAFHNIIQFCTIFEKFSKIQETTTHSNLSLNNMCHKSVCAYPLEITGSNCYCISKSNFFSEYKLISSTNQRIFFIAVQHHFSNLSTNSAWRL